METKQLTYSEKLRHPKWQKKRLEVMQRDKFICQLCGATEVELHVHHKEYSMGKEPWEYDLSNFQTLCKFCHRISEEIKLKYGKEQPLIKKVFVEKTADPFGYRIIVRVSSSEYEGVGVYAYFLDTNEVFHFISLTEPVIDILKSLFQTS